MPKDKIKQLINGKQLNVILTSWVCVPVRDDDVESARLWCKDIFGPWLSGFFELKINAAGNIRVGRPEYNGTANLSAKWDLAISNGYQFVFRHEEDAVLFKLRWG